MAGPVHIILEIRRGLKADLPILSDGEFGYCTDTKELFIGNAGVNHLVPKYSPATPADWSPQPTSIVEAIDRIAAIVAILNGGPI